MTIDAYQAVPAALRACRQWLVWQFEQKPGDKKPRKVPYYISGKRRAGVQGSDEDRAALAEFAAVCTAAERQAESCPSARHGPLLPADTRVRTGAAFTRRAWRWSRQ